MVSDFIAAAGPVFWLVVALMWLAIIATTFYLPFAVISIARSLRKISEAVERISPPDAPRPQWTYAAPSTDHAEPAVATPGHQLLR